jgi:DNA-binding transcriptional LysR family regulator
MLAGKLPLQYAGAEKSQPLRKPLLISQRQVSPAVQKRGSRGPGIGNMLHARLLRYLDEVARCGSIRKAGANLNVASSAINRQILAFERELKTPIFQRLPHRVILTAAGELIVGHVRETLRAMATTQAQIEELRGLKRGEISIGVVSGLAGTLTPLAISRFRQSRPRVRFRVTLLSGTEIAQRVAEGDIDLGLGFNLQIDKRLKVLASATSRLGAVVRVGHPLAGRRTVRISDCIGYPICAADRTMAIYALLEGAIAQSAIVLEPIVETNSVEVMRRMTEIENCLTFLSKFETLLSPISDGNLVYIPLQAPKLKDEALMLIGGRKSANRNLDSLVETFRNIMFSLAA